MAEKENPGKYFSALFAQFVTNRASYDQSQPSYNSHLTPAELTEQATAPIITVVSKALQPQRTEKQSEPETDESE